MKFYLNVRGFKTKVRGIKLFCWGVNLCNRVLGIFKIIITEFILYKKGRIDLFEIA